MAKKIRCGWSTAQNDPLYIRYHDEEWGVPLHDDNKLFEFLVLEGAQAGLSWLTVLRKREGYRKAFENFSPGAVANFNGERIKRLTKDPTIIRNKLKIASTVKNARHFLEVQEEFGSFDNYVWSFVPNRRPIDNRPRKSDDIPTRSKESDALSKDLVRRGFSFVGTTICYAHMQATGMINDHLISCFRHDQVRKSDRCGHIVSTK